MPSSSVSVFASALRRRAALHEKARGLLSWTAVRGHHVVVPVTALVIGSQRMVIIACAMWCEPSHHTTADASVHDAHGAVQHVSMMRDGLSAAPDQCRHVFARFRPDPTQVVAQPAVAPMASVMATPPSSAIPQLSVARFAADHGPPVLVLRI